MLAERVKEWTHEWEEKGIQKGMQKGETGILLRQMYLKFGNVDAETLAKVESAGADQLLIWSEYILSAKTIEEMFKT